MVNNHSPFKPPTDLPDYKTPWRFALLQWNSQRILPSSVIELTSKGGGIPQYNLISLHLGNSVTKWYRISLLNMGKRLTNMAHFLHEQITCNVNFQNCINWTNVPSLERVEWCFVSLLFWSKFYLLLTKCAVRTVHKLWTKFFTSPYGPSGKCMGNKYRGGNEDP